MPSRIDTVESSLEPHIHEDKVGHFLRRQGYRFFPGRDTSYDDMPASMHLLGNVTSDDPIVFDYQYARG